MHIETEWLMLRDFCESDLNDLQAILGDADIEGHAHIFAKLENGIQPLILETILPVKHFITLK